MRSLSAARVPLAFVPYGIVGAVHLAALVAASSGVDVSTLLALTKPLLMPALLLAFLVGVPSLRASATVLGVVAIAASWAGDLALMVPGDDMFLLGLGAFLVAHVFFVLLILRHLVVRRLPLAALAYLGWWIALVALLAPHVSWFVWPLAAYGVVLGLMAAAATRASMLVAAGGLLFLISDTVLGVSRFMPSFEIWHSDVLVMSTYIAAQGLLAGGAVLHLRRRHSIGRERAPGTTAGIAPVITVDAAR